MTRSSDQCILYILYHDKVLWVEILNALVVCFLYIRPCIKQIKINICQIPSNIKVIWIYIAHTHIYISCMYMPQFYVMIMSHPMSPLEVHVVSQQFGGPLDLMQVTTSWFSRFVDDWKVRLPNLTIPRFEKWQMLKRHSVLSTFSWQVIRLVASVWRTLKAQKVPFTVV